MLIGEPLRPYFPGTPGIGEALDFAAHVMAREIPAFLTEAEVNTVGVANVCTPNTHSWLQTLDDPSVYKFGVEPPLSGASRHSTQSYYPLVYSGSQVRRVEEMLPIYQVKNLHIETIITPGHTRVEMPENMISLDYNSFTGMYEPPIRNKLWEGTKRFGRAVQPYIPLIDAGLHVWIETQKQDIIDFNHAMSQGLVNTGIDTVVYGGTFSAIGAAFGGPGVWGTVAFTIGSEFLPDYSKEDIHNTIDMMLYAIEERDSLAFIRASQAVKEMETIKGIKTIGEVFRYVSEETRDNVNDIFPRFVLALSSGFKLICDTGENEFKKINNLLISVCPLAEPKEIRTFTEMRQDANDCYKALLMQADYKSWAKREQALIKMFRSEPPANQETAQTSKANKELLQKLDLILR